jgi:2-hydroxychromene-2-carboxylate isomerase
VASRRANRYARRMQPQLSFWFEFGSTYSYLSASRIEALAQQRGVQVVYRPFLLGPIFRVHGWENSPFNLYPAKGRYMWRDMARLAADLGLPFRPPSVFPRNGLLAARVALAVEPHGVLPALVPKIYAAEFADDQDIADPQVLAPLLERVGLDPAAVFAEANSETIKRRLRDQTALAQTLGIFGAPSFTVDQELFWGNDRLEQALAWAAASAPVDRPGGACPFPNDF